MKIHLLFLLLAFSVTGFAANTPQHTDLTVAVPAKTVQLTPVAQGGLGSQNLMVKIKNVTGKVAFIKVPAGLHFKSPDPNAQDMFTATEVLLAIQPNSQKEVPLRGYCMNASNYSPSSGAVYAFNGYARPELKNLGDSLNKYPAIAQDYGQMFVWAITDRRGLYDVTTAPEHMQAASNIVKYVSSVTRQPLAKVGKSTTGHNAPSVEVFSKKIIFMFHNPKDDVASFKIYDEGGNVVRTLYENRKLSHGLLNYAVGYNEMIPYGSDPKYFLKVINKEGKVLAEKQFDKNSSEASDHSNGLNFTFEYVLDKAVKNAALRVYLTDGTLVEEFKKYDYLAVGGYRVHIRLNHMYPANTRFVAKLETPDGTLIKKQEVGGK